SSTAARCPATPPPTTTKRCISLPSPLRLPIDRASKRRTLKPQAARTLVCRLLRTLDCHCGFCPDRDSLSRRQSVHIGQHRHAAIRAGCVLYPPPDRGGNAEAWRAAAVG